MASRESLGKSLSKGAAPAACTAASRGSRSIRPSDLSLDQRFAECRSVTEVARREHDPVGRIPVQLMQQLEDDRLLPFDPKWIDRVQEIDAEAGTGLLGEPEAGVEIAADQEGLRSVGE